MFLVDRAFPGVSEALDGAGPVEVWATRRIDVGGGRVDRSGSLWLLGLLSVASEGPCRQSTFVTADAPLPPPIRIC